MEAGKGALIGLATGGLPGAILGGLLGPARAQIARNVQHNRNYPDNRINPLNGLFNGYKGIFGGWGGSTQATSGGAPLGMFGGATDVVTQSILDNYGPGGLPASYGGRADGIFGGKADKGGKK